MITRRRCCSLIFFALGIGLGSASHAQEPVEYVRICSKYGSDFFFVPGRDICVNALNGEIRQQTDQGVVRRDSFLAARVRALESNYCDECFAVLSKDGSIHHSEKLEKARRIGTGEYELEFERRVGECALNATLGHPGNDGPPPRPGMITVAPTPGGEKGVSVRTYNAGGALSDRSFHLTLECKPKPVLCVLAGPTRCNVDELPDPN